MVLFVGCVRQNMLGPEDADDEEMKAEILEEARTCGYVEQVCPRYTGTAHV